MEVFSLTQARRFLRERPMRIGVFDRPRLVCELLCLEPEQQETRPTFPASDQLYVILEGRARIRAGPQIQEAGAQEALLVPPGVDHYIANAGGGRLTALALVAPKPSRSGEVRMPAAGGRRGAVGPRPRRERPVERPRGEGAAASRFGSGRQRPAPGPRAGEPEERDTRPPGRRASTGGEAPRRRAAGRPAGRGGAAESGRGRRQGRRGPAPGRGNARAEGGPTPPASGRRGRPGSGRSGPRTSGRR